MSSLATGSMTRVNTVASALKRFFSTDSSKGAALTPDSTIEHANVLSILFMQFFLVRLPGSVSSASISTQQPRFPAGSMKISDQTIEEVDEQLTITSMRANEPRPTAQSLFIPYSASQPVDVPTTTYMPRDYTRTYSGIEPPTSNSFIFPNADSDFFVSASAPLERTECPDTQSQTEGFDFHYKDAANNDDDDNEDEFEKLRLTREKERQERQKLKLARSISTQQNPIP